MKRISKAEIYKQYGITYKSGKVLTPLNTWVKPLLPVGTNSKVGNAATFSIYHGNEMHDISEFKNVKIANVLREFNVTSFCGSCAQHCKGCYCDSGFYNMPDVKAGNIRKLLLVTYFPKWTEAVINAQIKADGILQVRIHASGDFFTEAYTNIWKRIALNNPHVIFWTYTKNSYALEIFKNVPNLTIVPSMTVKGINFGTCKELLKLYNELVNDGYKVHICACGTDKEIHCSDCKHGCKAVGTECDYVLFIKHSTGDYKAGENDINDFKAIYNIILKQNN